MTQETETPAVGGRHGDAVDTLGHPPVYHGAGKTQVSPALLDTALAYAGAGISVLPCNQESKRPIGYLLPKKIDGKTGAVLTDREGKPLHTWEPFKEQIADAATIRGWFAGGKVDALATLGGEISGNLETIDHDAPKLFAPWCDLVEDLAPGLLSRLVIRKTQSGKRHVAYRCPVIAGNVKLAMEWTIGGNGEPKRETLIETRGEGGYTLTEPTRGYELLQGKMTALPVITPDERAILLSAARSFNLATEENRPGKTATKKNTKAGGLRPGDDFNERGEALPILERHGWRVVGQAGEALRLRRPGKDRGGCSATWGYIPNRLYVFSTNAYPFEDGKTYNLFAIYAILEHSGDFTAAARELASRGFGTNGTESTVEPSAEPSAETAQPDIKTLLKFGYEDEGNARTVAALHGDKLCFCEAYGWLYWNGRYWEREGAEAILDGIVLDVLKLRRAAAVKAEKEAIVKTAKPSAYRLRGTKTILKSLLTVRVGDFDAGHFHLNCQNGVVDLRTGEIMPHDPAQRFTYCTPVDYDPNASQTIWRDFLRDALGDGQELQDYVQEAVGYSFTGDTSEEVLFYGFGPRRGGKGCFTETLMATLGRRPLADEVDFATFTAKRKADTQNFDLAGLKPCRFIVASESSKYRQLNAAKVKALTGGNDIRCAHKNKPFFTYRPQFKIWLMSNHPVNADVDDDAAWYRVQVIPFPNSYAGREDKSLKRRLREPANLRGVLAWAIQGAIAWHGRGSKGLQTPECVKVATATARQDLDFVGQWLDECMEVIGNSEDFMANAAIYASYESWAENNGVTPKKKRSLTVALKRKGLDAGQQKKVGGKNWRGCYGIRLAVGGGNEPEPLNF